MGDYVVHEEHGLGIYRGIEKVERDKVVKDYIKIEYGDGGNLYLPATRLESIQKYAGSEAKKPKLNRLGGSEWTKTRAKVKGAVQEIAKDLVKLYAARQEQLPPKVVKKGNATALEPQKPITNYNFISEDGRWKLNLTQGFIALSTLSYTRWEDFATRLDRPLAQFIQLYQPAFFERIGLRYVNAVSRQRLGLEGELWDDLIRSQYIGILGEPDVEESEIAKCSLDVETPLVGDYRMKLHAGPGLIGGGKTDKEVKFILDGDFSTAGKHNPDAVPEKLERMHRFAVCLFQGAITKELHEAMGPTPLAE